MRALLIPIVAFLIVGCISTTEEVVPTEPISLELRCDHCTVAVEEEVPIHVILRNNSDRPVRIVEPRHNIFDAFTNELSRDGEIIDGHSVAWTWLKDPYFYYWEPVIRDGGSETPVTLTEEYGLVYLPPGLEWEGFLGTTVYYTYEDRCESEIEYTAFTKPGVYTVRVRYCMDSQKKPPYRLKEGWKAAIAETPALDIVSNALVITVNEGNENK